MLSTAPSSSEDLFSDTALADPYPLYARLRDAGPLVWMTGLGCWAVPRYDGVRSVLEDWEGFTSDRGVGLNDDVNSALQGTLLASSPPLHDTLRSILAEPLSPRGLRTLKMDLKQRAADLVDPLVQRGRFDAVNDLARVFPPTVVADLVGIPDAKRDRLLPWADAIFNMMGPADKARTFASADLVGEQFAWLATLTKDDLDEGSWGQAIYQAAEDGRLRPEQAPTLLSAYTSAAMDTTVNVLSSAILLFAQNPEQWEKVREDRSLIPSAFNEALRLESPLQFFTRVATRDLEPYGTRVEAGQRLMVVYASANRDERHWGPTAADFDVERDAADHLAFGYGMHGCIGQGLARLEAHAVFEVLADRVSSFHLAAEPERRLNSAIRGLDRVVVDVTAA